MTFVPPNLARDRETFARSIVTTPEVYLAMPETFGTAWATLLAARGCTHRLDRLRPAHVVSGRPAGPLAEALNDIRARGLSRRIRDRARQLGQHMTGDDLPDPAA